MSSPASGLPGYARPLLATDLSEGAAHAARIASRVVASDARGTVLLVVSEPEVPRIASPDLREELLEAIRTRWQDAEPEVASWARANGLPGWEASAPRGPVASTIVHEARVLRSDVVIVGASGHGRVERALLGSVARAVLHRAHADVLVARAREQNGTIRHVLVATDLQEPSVAAARRALAIADANAAKLSLLHVLDRGEWAGALYPTDGPDIETLRKRLLDELDSFGRRYLDGRAEAVLAVGRAARGIVAKADELDADLVVLGTHGGTALARALLGSVADAVAERAGCSVLVVRGQEA